MALPTHVAEAVLQSHVTANLQGQAMSGAVQYECLTQLLAINHSFKMFLIIFIYYNKTRKPMIQVLWEPADVVLYLAKCLYLRDYY